MHEEFAGGGVGGDGRNDSGGIEFRGESDAFLDLFDRGSRVKDQFHGSMS